MRIWIDLTDFLQWKGNLTGIQRIQFNMSKLYIESGSDVKFFVYHEREREFTEVDFVPDEIVKSGIVSAAPGKPRTHDYLSKTAELAAQVRRRILPKRQMTNISHVPVSAPFLRDDTVLIMGGIWVGSFISDLRSVKDRQQFKLVHFAFDMIPSLFPGFVVEWLPEVFTEYQKQVFTISEGIIAISESTATDVRNFIKQHSIKNNPEITVVRIGETIDELIDTKREERIESLEPGFLLSVSTVEARKNHLALFYMLREADRRGIKLPKIVIVGRNGWQTDDFRYTVQRDPVARENIVIINDADDAMLVWLYRNCLFTVFPSFYEGWGMPVAESLAYGKLCLSSDTSSMPEIAGDLIDYFSPYDTGAILESVMKYLDPETLTAREKQIKQEYVPTSWREMHTVVSAFVDSLN